MVIFTTLKANKEHKIDNRDIALYVEESWTVVAELFEDADNYLDKWDDTDFDKLYADYTERQVASACLKYLKKYAKEKDSCMMIWNKMFIDLDCDGEIAFEQIKKLIADGVITGSNQIREIENKASKKGRSIRSREYCYDEENHYYRRDYVDDLIDEYFPCNSDNGGCCNNCGNCQ